LRKRFIDALIAAFPDPGQGVTPDVCLVLTLRADFYNAALRYRPLADRLQDHVENLVVRIKRLRPSTFGQAIEMTHAVKDSSV
jgi:hypothetical protein